MRTGTVREIACSTTWHGAAADVSVIVATHDRVHFLPGLMDCLAAQTAAVEVIVADDGSTDGTWPWLCELAARTTVPLLAMRLVHTGGPSVPRNTAASRARATVLAVTDDDCLPEPGWAAALATALDGGAAIAQGRTWPADDPRGPWDRAVCVLEPSWLFETCNLGFVRTRFIGLGGFPTLTVLSRLPRGFGEDVVLGARAAQAGFAWAGDAVVRHRWIATDYAGHLHGVRRLSGFPWLAREVPGLADRLVGGVFLSRRSAAYDVALLAVVVAATARRPSVLLGTLPWLRRAVSTARQRPGRPVTVRVVQEGLADTVGLMSLIEGSFRHRRVVL